MIANRLNSKFEIRNSKLGEPALPASGKILTQRLSVLEPQPKGSSTQRRRGAETQRKKMDAARGNIEGLHCRDVEEEGKESFSVFPLGLRIANLGNRSFPQGFFLPLRLCVSVSKIASPALART
jgi:hypothetical protein